MILRRPHWARAGLTSLVAAALLGACGGGNPLDNPDDVQNPPGSSGRKLAYAYFQRCIFPIFLAQLPVHNGPPGATNTCAGGGCHDDTTGTGGALRVIRGATPLDVTDAANTPDVIRASDMYKNYYSAQGVTIPGESVHSRLLAKPLLLNMLHGGGQIFENEEDQNAKLIQFWIDHPAPRDQDEFSPATYGMFNPPDPNTGTCRTQ
ncbi:MAG TPA: hypothetical protein VFY73_24010 [Ideonella sp.]|jgi:hypothetical protein|uniref:hypothetical protein n=1 Tax=Ideonella sp. TaxID=1929293 RepID=UPI002E3104DA|nr:hypothetical protein [Ideonella sp.]HEX5687091.1 hypothetical protein [Ideonella sp.]